MGAEARGPDLVALVERCASRAGLVLADEFRARLADLSSDYLPVRYPDALPGGTPASHYGRAQADRAVETAAAVLAAVDARWGALHEAGVGRSAARGSPTRKRSWCSARSRGAPLRGQDRAGDGVREGGFRQLRRGAHRGSRRRGDPGERLGRCGRAYLDFARTEPDADEARRLGLSAWVTVHGLAALLLDGPLAEMGEVVPAPDNLADSVLGVLVAGLRAQPSWAGHEKGEDTAEV